MAVWTYEDLPQSLIANTNMQKGYGDGVFKLYRIFPCDGYVLHDNTLDTEILGTDPETGDEITTILLGYTGSMTTCGANYDFVANSRDFYAVLENDVPPEQIFGVPDEEHEVM